MKRTRIQRKVGVRRVARRPITDKELDDLCREIVFRRDRYACAWCLRKAIPMQRERDGATYYHRLQWAHIYSRNKKSMRWDPDNSMALCSGCHLRWHHRPTEAVEWFAATYPERHARLKLLAGTPSKLDRAATKLYLEQQLGLAGHQSAERTPGGAA